MRSWLSVLIADARSKKRDDIPIAPSLYSLSNKMDNSLLAVRDINHKYIVVEMGLKLIVRRRKPGYTKGHPYKLFRNILEQDFTCDEINTKWCTDFTYLYLSDGSKRYNCTIIDLHDRSVVASITNRNITSELAICTLRKVIESQSEIKGVLNFT